MKRTSLTLAAMLSIMPATVAGGVVVTVLQS